MVWVAVPGTYGPWLAKHLVIALDAIRYALCADDPLIGRHHVTRHRESTDVAHVFERRLASLSSSFG